MSAFKFRLETLLKLRCADRDQRRSELSEAEQAIAILAERAAQLDAEAEAARSGRTPAPGAVDIDALLASHRYEMVLGLEKKQIGQQQKLLDEAVEQRRQVLVEADRKVRMLEKLKENQLAEHDRIELLREIKLFDEVSARIAAPAS